jgi:citrate synthase
MTTEREKIEAELRMSERERIAAKLKDLIHDFDETEHNLQKLEAEQGLPTFYRTKPLAERMKHLGMSREAIEQIEVLLAAIESIVKGDELPEATKKLLAQQADAEYSAIDQLASLLESRKARP